MPSSKPRGSPVIAVRVTPRTAKYIKGKGSTRTRRWLNTVIENAIKFEVETGYNFLSGRNDVINAQRNAYIEEQRQGNLTAAKAAEGE